MKNKIKYHYLKDNVFVPITVTKEWRNSIRFSITKKGAYLRIPSVLSQTKIHKELSRMNAWIEDQIHVNPQLKASFTLKSYTDGQKYVVGQRTYTLRVIPDQAHSFRVQLVKGIITIKYPAKSDIIQLNQVIPKLLSKVIGRDYYLTIVDRVIAINSTFFQLELNKISLKYNLSNWGSCSSSGNINLSTRLLFAPGKVIDYVIIHELAHRLEMNHSSRFYEIVENAMPDYKEQEKWLKGNSHLCNF